MGLDPAYPVVEANDPSTFVPIYDDGHQQVGRLGGASTRTNVFCMSTKWDAPHYRQLSTVNNDIPSQHGWIHADQVHVFGRPPYPVPQCQDLTGCLSTRGALRRLRRDASA